MTKLFRAFPFLALLICFSHSENYVLTQKLSHGDFDFMIAKCIYHRIHQGKDDCVEKRNHFVSWESPEGASVDKNGRAKHEEHNDDVCGACGDCLALPLRGVTLHTAQDDSVGSQKPQEAQEGEQPTVGDHQ